jgi:hypothetical protein
MRTIALVLVIPFSVAIASCGSGGTPATGGGGPCHTGSSCCALDNTATSYDIGFTNGTACTLTAVLDGSATHVTLGDHVYYFNNLTVGAHSVAITSGCGYSATVNVNVNGVSGPSIIVACSNGDGSNFIETTTP